MNNSKKIADLILDKKSVINGFVSMVIAIKKKL